MNHIAANNTDFKLTPEQVNFFHVFGYLVLPGLFAEDMPKIRSEYQTVFSESSEQVLEWKHQAHHGYDRKVLPQFIDRSAYFSSFIDDSRVHNVFTALCGENFSYRGSDANIFQSGTVWHSDTYGALFKYLNVKIAIYLEDLDETSGCFRVIPGSHLFGDEFANNLQNMLGKNDSLKDDLGLDDIDVPAQIIPTQPGDMLVFDFRLKHATCFEGEAADRRSFTICASERIDNSDILKLRDAMKPAAQLGYSHYYGEKMMATANEERLVHLEQCMAHDDVLQNV